MSGDTRWSGRCDGPHRVVCRQIRGRSMNVTGSGRISPQATLNSFFSSVLAFTQYLDGNVTHHHGEHDHLVWLERPFHQIRQALESRLTAGR